jgi:hypothetical protein
VTVVLCVKPPVDGLPLPYVPFRVSVYVPAGVVRLLVVIVAVLVFAAVPLSETGVGETEHVAPVGAPLQASPTLPVKPLSGVKVRVYVVPLPGLTDCVLGLAASVKSLTSCDTPAEVLELKFEFPA